MLAKILISCSTAATQNLNFEKSSSLIKQLILILSELFKYDKRKKKY